MIRLERKQSKCVDCKLDCEFRGNDSYPRVKDLVKVPAECDYKKEIQKTATMLSNNLSKHVATLNQALMTAQQMRSYMISQQQIKAIMEMNKYYQQQMKTIAESIARFSEVARSTEMLSAIRSYRNFQPYLEATRDVARLMSMSTPMYFTSKEFLVLEETIKIPKKSVEMKLIERLNACPKGKEGWTEFQDICKAILKHLYVPPLMEPFEQSRTETGLHIRDLIFDIPYSVKNFWAYIRDKFDASALVVECKNYSSPIEGNQIVISSKYLGKNRLGRFGIVFSRFDPAESAVKEVKRLWTEDGKLVLCLANNHLIKMLELKGKNKEPEIVIDNAIHEFLRALE
jgi:hypothetical protein